MKETAVIAGVGPGLGAALVRACAARGMTVIAAARHIEDRASLYRDSDGADILPVNCDLTRPEEVAALFRTAREQSAPLRLTVFNAGAFRKAAFREVEPEDFEQCWRVGCYAGFLVGQQAAANMLDTGQGGSILFTGATASLRGGPGFVNLAMPKFGLRAVAQSMARELGPEGIHVAHMIIDGQIRSEGTEHLLEERGPDSLLEPDAIAAAYLQIHDQPASAWSHEVDLRPWTERF